LPKESFATEITHWRQLAASVLKEAEALPHLGPQATQLADLVAQLQKLRTLQNQLEGKLAIATRRLQDGRTLGRDLSSRLQAGLKQVHGVHSGHLQSYGLRPRRQARKSKPAEADPDEVPS
jgi:hypothetical protein